MNKYLRTFGCLIILTILSATSLYAAPNAYISWKYVNLRESPSEDALIITRLVKGTKVTILEQNSDWYRVVTEEELLGWTVKRSLKVTGKIDFNKPAPVKKPVPVKKEPAITTAAKPTAKPAKPKKEGLTFKEKTQKQKKSIKEEDIKEDAKAEPTDIGYLKTPVSKLPESPSLFGAFARMLSALFIILGSILLLYFIVKKYFSKSILSLEGASVITVLASKYIGQKTIIYILDILEKIIVVAVSGTEIKMLTEITEKDSIERMRKDISAIKENEKPFKKFFSEKIKVKQSASGKNEENFDILDDLNEKLQKKVDDFKDINY